jgi:hypothetical protein
MNWQARYKKPWGLRPFTLRIFYVAELKQLHYRALELLEYLTARRAPYQES